MGGDAAMAEDEDSDREEGAGEDEEEGENEDDFTSRVELMLSAALHAQTMIARLSKLFGVLERLLFDSGGDPSLADEALSLLQQLSASCPRKLLTEYAVGCIQRMLASDVAERRRPTAVSMVTLVVQAARQPHQQRLLIHSGIIDELLQHIIPRCARTNEVIVSILATALEWAESGCDPTSPRMQRWCQTIAESRDKLAALEGQSTAHCFQRASQLQPGA
jgi:hypothetical protein